MVNTTSPLAEPIERHRDDIRAIVAASRASNPRLFGYLIDISDRTAV
jgi:hypothetical protein